MNETEKMQKLHQLAAEGQTLTPEEQTALQNWYENLDREEDLILENSQSDQNASDLRAYLAETAKQVTIISREVETLVSQNETLRNENQSLRKTLEARLLEKVV